MRPASSSRFQTTSWSLVLAAARHPTAESRIALTDLCSIYWSPVYAFVRRSGYDRDRAQDLTQGFFAVLLEKNYVSDADRERGRFRSFLLTAVKHFLANEWDRAHALKRGGFQMCPFRSTRWKPRRRMHPKQWSRGHRKLCSNGGG